VAIGNGEPFERVVSHRVALVGHVHTKSPSDDPMRLGCTRIGAFHTVLGFGRHFGGAREGGLVSLSLGPVLGL